MRNTNNHTESSDFFYVDELLQNLIVKIDAEILNPEIQEFVDKFRKAQNFKSNSELYFDLQRLDTRKDINKHLQFINNSMRNESKKYFFGLVQTVEDKKKSSALIKTPILKFLFIFSLFFFRRFLPKIIYLKNVSFIQSLRIYSQAEIMGRLHYCGFKIVQFNRLENNLHYFLASRDSIPKTQKVEEGLFVKLNRIGKNGRRFNVLKIRTMHPYSEFIHQYLIENNGFDAKGKIKNDFRTSGWGRFLRKTWLDELPQLINVLKGDMKIFGIRPVSESYFNTLDHEYQTLRNNHKPGCIPPYLVFANGSSKEKVVEAEIIYLNKCKENRTFWIDCKYTLSAVYNIIFKGRRSS